MAILCCVAQKAASAAQLLSINMRTFWNCCLGRFREDGSMNTGSVHWPVCARQCDGPMDEGSEGDKTSREGGLPTLPRSLPQYNSAFATRVLQSTYVCVKGERSWALIFKLFKTPGINSTELADWFRKPFIFLLHSHYYIYRQNRFLGHFCPP
jgi:hypothetical protein